MFVINLSSGLIARVETLTYEVETGRLRHIQWHCIDSNGDPYGIVQYTQLPGADTVTMISAHRMVKGMSWIASHLGELREYTEEKFILHYAFEKFFSKDKVVVEGDTEWDM